MQSVTLQYMGNNHSYNLTASANPAEDSSACFTITMWQLLALYQTVFRLDWIGLDSSVTHHFVLWSSRFCL